MAVSESDDVRGQYEDYPYPSRDPADEKKRLLTGSPSHLLELNHYVFAGARDFAKPFRALVAGGGTGDAAIMLAQQLADAGGPGEVVYIDISEAARDIAAARAAVRGLENISFHLQSIEEAEASALGTFDYIDCCGVLHHLADPEDGLATLAGLLDEGGGLGVMLYGTFGRTGVYPFQRMMRMVAPNDAPAERIKFAEKLLKTLPPTNWLRRNPFVTDHIEVGPAGIYDLLLHARDRAYTVPEIAALVAGAGLELVQFVEPLRYDPDTYLTEPAVAKRLADQDVLTRATFAELLAGNMATHVFYAVAAGRAPECVAVLDDGAVPQLRNLDGADFARTFKPGQAMTADFSGIQIRRNPPPLAGAIMARIDGTKTVAEIYAELAEVDAKLERDKFMVQFEELFRLLNGLGKLFLTRAA